MVAHRTAAAPGGGGILVSRARAGHAGGVLSEQERAILAFEGKWWTLPGEKDALVQERFGLAPAGYAAVLADLLDRPDALDHDPLVVRRLRRLRDRNRRARTDGTARSEERA